MAVKTGRTALNEQPMAADIKIAKAYFGAGVEGKCSGAASELSSHAVYQRLSSIWDPAARR